MDIQYMFSQKAQNDVYGLYHSIGWQEHLNLTKKQYVDAMENSFYSVYVYDGDLLIGTGRVISDGVMNGYICGLGVLQDYRNRGIGNRILELLVKQCKSEGLHIQLFCEDRLVKYYENKGFKRFGAGMIME